MANPIKQLAGQTAIYGLSSIIARLLNYLLTPLYTLKFATEQYGVITEMYAYVAFLIIFLTYGMETAYFRFMSRFPDRKSLVFATAAKSLLLTSGLFILITSLFHDSIGNWMRYPDHTEYVIWFAFIVGLDAIGSIPLARLRAENKAFRFAGIQMTNVAVNIGLNIFFLVYCPSVIEESGGNMLTQAFYDPDIGVGYVFIANLVASAIKLLLLTPAFRHARGFDIDLWKQMLNYAWPLLIVGIGWYVNENFDRILLKYLLIDRIGEEAAMSQVGIYGANYKLSIIIILFIQAFRYAADPFYFSKQNDPDAPRLYASLMTYFVIIVCTIFLMITLFIDIFRYFIPNPDYWEGLRIVPVLLLANVFQGIYYNLSFWYKFTDKTRFGAWLALFGAAITLVGNFIFIPEYGYIACAWVTFTAYGSIMIVSYFLGQRFYRIPYEAKRIGGYVGLAVLIYLVRNELLNEYPGLGLSLMCFSIYLAWIILRERKRVASFTQA